MSQYTYVPGDSRLVDHIIGELKSKGIFDQFRKECISDVDTKPAYQNLRMRVEGSVSSFLSRQKWKSDINKNQLREKLRKHIIEANYLEQGVERIVDQVVNPKIASVFMPQVEDLVYSYLGIQKPKSQNDQCNSNVGANTLQTVSLETVNTQVVKLDLPTNVKPEEKMEIDDLIEDKDLKEPVAEPTKEEITIDNIVTEDSSDSIKFEAKEEIKEEFIVTTELSNLSIDIPLPDDPPKIAIQEETSEFKHSDTETSLDSAIVRNVSPLTPIRSFNNENSCDAQPAFEENSKNINSADEKKTDDPIPISTFRFTIEKDCQGTDEKMKKVNVETVYNEQSLQNYNPPVLDDSSSSNNLHIDYQSDKDATTVDSKAEEIKTEASSRTNDEQLKSKELQDEKKKSHKSSHSSRDSHRHTSSSKHSRDRRSDSKHHSDKKESSKSDKKSSRDESSHGKSRHSSHGEKSKERSDRDKKDSNDKREKDKGDVKDRHSSSHRSSSSKDPKSRHSSSSSRHHSSSSKNNGDKKSSSRRDEKRDGKDHNNSKSRDHSKSSHRPEKDKKSSNTKDKENKKDDKKEKKVTDDHYSASGRGNRTRRSTDRDSNDGNSSSSKGSTFTGGNKTARTTDNKSSTSKSENQSSGSDSTSQSDSVEVLNQDTENKVLKPVIQLESKLKTPITTSPVASATPGVMKKKPMIASNMTEALKLMKVRKQMAAEQEKKRQEAALLIEFQEKIHSSISQVYSGICGPELEFTCLPKYSTCVQTQQVLEETKSSQNDVTQENPKDEDEKSKVDQSLDDEYLNIVCGSPITEMNLKYFTQHETFTAELEQNRFRKFLDTLDKIDTRKTVFLLNSDFQYEQAIQNISEEMGNFTVMNLITTKPKLQPSILSAQELTKTEVVLPSPIISSYQSDDDDYAYNHNLSSESETTTDYEKKIDEIIQSKSRKDVMEIILGGMCTETPEVDNEIERDILKRKADCLIDECVDNNNHNVLMPMKIRRLSLSEQISSTTECMEVTITPNTFKSKFIGKARRVGLPKPKSSSNVSTSPLSDKSVENYDQNEQQVSTRKLNGTVDGKPRRSKIAQRYDTSDLYKPKLHYLSKRHSHVT